jgi:hypothetical protein
MKDIDIAIEQASQKPAPVEILPCESWERLQRETFVAYAAFCAYRDYGLERNILKTVESVEKDVAMRARKYYRWRKWSCKYRWRERAADYDRYFENLKQAEQRKTIEFHGEKFREITGKILDIVKEKLDKMNPCELTQKNVVEWLRTAFKIDLEAARLIESDCKPESKQVDFTFDFQGL